MKIDIKRNSFNLIRMLAAIQVMYGHVNGHLEINMPWVISQVVGGIFYGVPIFFTLSGFLIWHSAERSENYWTYIRKRFLRIYPELWVAVVFEIIAVIIFYKDYAVKDLCLFTFTQATFLQFWTPDSLRGYGVGTPNGALWTISILVQFYIVAYFLYKFLSEKKVGIWIGVFAASVFMSFFLQQVVEITMPEFVVKLYDQTIIRYFWMFLIGMFVARYFDDLIGVLIRFWPVFIIGASVLNILNVDVVMIGYGLIRTLLLFLGVAGFAYGYPRFVLKRDISYGVYIYHMTVVNIMVSLGLMHKPIYGAICIVISFMLGWISTVTIGKYVSSHKDARIRSAI